MKKDCGKLSTLEFRNYHAEMIHDNNEDLQKLIDRINDLEYNFERGCVSRQLIVISVVSTWFAIMVAVAVLIGLLSGGN
jgi:hypothetical protein